MLGFLLKLYPKAWRLEYGEELADVLVSGRLTVGVIADVLRGAAYQRARSIPTWAVVGLVLLCLDVAHMFVARVTYVNGRPLTGWWNGSYPVFASFTLDNAVRSLFSLIVVVTAGWLAARKGGSFLKGFRGATGAFLIRLLPSIVLILLPGATASNDDGPVLFATKLGMLVWFLGNMLVMSSFLAGVGSLTGTLVARVVGRKAK